MEGGLTFTQALRQLDMLLGRSVSVVFGAFEVGTYPVVSLNGRLNRADEAGVAAYTIVNGEGEPPLLILTKDVFRCATWDDQEDALRFQTTSGVILVTTKLHVGISKRR